MKKWLRQVKAESAQLFELMRKAPGRRPSEQRQLTYVLVAQGRTGSTLLESLLSSHPDWYDAGEFFSRRKYFAVQRLKIIRKLSACTVFGFHLKPYHPSLNYSTELSGFLDLLDRTLGVDVYIRLSRKNILRHALSLQTIMRDGVAHIVEDTNGRALKIEVDVEDLIMLMESRLAQTESEDDALRGRQVIEIEYESDLEQSASQVITCKGLFRQFNVCDFEPKTQLTKRLHGRLDEFISNYPELLEKVSKTRFAQFLD